LGQPRQLRPGAPRGRQEARSHPLTRYVSSLGYFGSACRQAGSHSDRSSRQGRAPEYCALRRVCERHPGGCALLQRLDQRQRRAPRAASACDVGLTQCPSLGLGDTAATPARDAAVLGPALQAHKSQATQRYTKWRRRPHQRQGCAAPAAAPLLLSAPSYHTVVLIAHVR